MTENYSAKLPAWFWIVSVLFVIWNLFGIANYIMSVTATSESLAAQNYTPEQIEFLLNIPALNASLFALAVWSGLLASILLLLRRRAAVPVYLFSLIFVILSFIFDFLAGAFDILGSVPLVIMCVVTVLAVLEYMFSRSSRSKAWLR